MNCIMENTSVVPSSNFVDFIHRASRICLGQSAKALVWRWRQICPLNIDIFTLSAPNSTNEVSMFKLAIEVCFENHFGLIHAIFLSLGSTKSGYFFLGHPVVSWERRRKCVQRNEGGWLATRKKNIFWALFSMFFFTL